MRKSKIKNSYYAIEFHDLTTLSYEFIPDYITQFVCSNNKIKRLGHVKFPKNLKILWQ